MHDQTVPEDLLQRLIVLAQDGDTDAFGAVYEQFFAPVYRYVAFRVPREVAEDLVADIFVKAWEKLYTYAPQKGVPFGAWIFRIARHTVIDSYRTFRTWEELPEEMVDPDAMNSADNATRQGYVLQAVRKAIQSLPRRYRDVLLLTYIAGLPTAEVGRVLRLRVGAVRILRLRAIRKLQAALPPDLQEEQPSDPSSLRNTSQDSSFSSVQA